MPLANIDYTVLISGLDPWLTSVTAVPLLPLAPTQATVYDRQRIHMKNSWTI
jgi:hypothetical protein